MGFQPVPALELQELRGDLEEWRACHRAPESIPSRIWSEAIRLARVHGIGQVARALKLDYGRLKQKMNGETARRNPQAAERFDQQTFVELVGPMPIGRCRLRLESARGKTIEADLKSVAPSALAVILRELVS